MSLWDPARSKQKLPFGKWKLPWRHGQLPYLHLKVSLSTFLCWVLASEETYQHGAFPFPSPGPGWQLEAKVVEPQGLRCAYGKAEQADEGRSV